MAERSSSPHPYFGVPPARQPRQVADEPTLWGKRVVLSTPEGFVYDMRVISEIYRDRNGRDAVDIVTEADYYRWMFLHEPPRVESFPARLVWVE